MIQLASLRQRIRGRLPSLSVPPRLGAPPPRAGSPVPKGRSAVLGIEIARGGLRFVELKTIGGKPTLLQHGVVAYGTSERLTDVLRFVVEEYGIEARDVHVVDTTSRANLKIHTLPTMPASELGMIIRGEIATEAELLGEQLVGDWTALRDSGQDVEALIGKIPIRDRDQLATACREADLRLQVMTSSSVVLAKHLLVTGEVLSGETIGLLDIGRSKMNMALLADDQIRVVREVYQGLSAQFLEGAREASDLESIGEGLDEIVATVQQIKRTVQQYEELHPGAIVHHIAITGETTRIARLLGLLEHDLQIPVRPYDPSSVVSRDRLPQEFSDAASTFAVPWILATTPAADFSLNFAEGVPDLRPVRRLQVGVAVAAAGVVALGAWQFRESEHLEQLQAKAQAVRVEKENLEAELGLLEEVKVQWDRWLAEQVEHVGFPTPDLRPHVAELIAGLPDSVRLTRLSFLREGPSWRMEADALAITSSTSASHAAMELFVRTIDSSPLIEDVTMRPLRYQSDRRQGSRVELEFSLSASLRLIRGATS